MFRPELYPANWKTLRTEIVEIRAHGQCECIGQCGLHGGFRHVHRCVERNGLPARFARGKIVLTLAHLCNCVPLCGDHAHLIAACQRCHLRIDRYTHAKKRLETQRLQRVPSPPTEAP